MRISATSANTVARDTPAARRAGAGVFSLADDAGSAPRTAASQLQAVAGIDTLVALQGVEDTSERRRRAVRKGRGALDALDELKLGLLAGTIDPSALNRLRALSGELGESTGDGRLDAVLAEIDLRVQVEVAKLSRR